MFKYTFQNGDVMTSKLDKEEIIKRLNRLDTLRVIMEGYDEGVGRDICEKALRAYNKMEEFTGIIRLTSDEKDFLCYKLESPYLSDEERKVIEFYIG